MFLKKLEPEVKNKVELTETIPSNDNTIQTAQNLETEIEEQEIILLKLKSKQDEVDLKEK